MLFILGIICLAVLFIGPIVFLIVCGMFLGTAISVSRPEAPPPPGPDLW